MLSPRVGGGGGAGRPGEFDILMGARVKFPTPRHLLNGKDMSFTTSHRNRNRRNEDSSIYKHSIIQ